MKNCSKNANEKNEVLNTIRQGVTDEQLLLAKKAFFKDIIDGSTQKKECIVICPVSGEWETGGRVTPCGCRGRWTGK